MVPVFYRGRVRAHTGNDIFPGLLVGGIRNGAQHELGLLENSAHIRCGAGIGLFISQKRVTRVNNSSFRDRLYGTVPAHLGGNGRFFLDCGLRAVPANCDLPVVLCRDGVFLQVLHRDREFHVR